MERSYYRTLLLDFYGELLTDKQREYFDWHYNNDLSLAEIAQSEGITRQGVWDSIRRAEDSMRRLEQKTGLIARGTRQREITDRAAGLLQELKSLTSGRAGELVRLLETELQELRHGL